MDILLVSQLVILFPSAIFIGHLRVALCLRKRDLVQILLYEN